MSDSQKSAEPNKIHVFALKPYGQSIGFMIKEWGKNEHVQIHELESTIQLSSALKKTMSGLVMIHVSDKNMIAMQLNFLKQIGGLIKSNLIRVLASTDLKNDLLQRKLRESGVFEIINEPISEKTISFKMGRYLSHFERMNKQISQRETEKAKKGLGKKEGAGSQSSNPKNDDSKQVKLVEPLKIQSDCWINKGGSARKVLKKWIITVRGPAPDVGKWQPLDTAKGSDDQIWEWQPRNPDKDEFIREKGKWLLIGQRPEYRNDFWTFVGEKPKLTFESDGKILGKKFEFSEEEGGLVVARDSKVALEFLPKILLAMEKVFKSSKEKQSEEEVELKDKSKSGSGESEKIEESESGARDEPVEEMGARKVKSQSEGNDVEILEKKKTAQESSEKFSEESEEEKDYVNRPESEGSGPVDRRKKSNQEIQEIQDKRKKSQKEESADWNEHDLSSEEAEGDWNDKVGEDEKPKEWNDNIGEDEEAKNWNQHDSEKSDDGTDLNYRGKKDKSEGSLNDKRKPASDKETKRKKYVFEVARFGARGGEWQRVSGSEVWTFVPQDLLESKVKTRSELDALRCYWTYRGESGPELTEDALNWVFFDREPVSIKNWTDLGDEVRKHLKQYLEEVDEIETPEVRKERAQGVVEQVAKKINAKVDNQEALDQVKRKAAEILSEQNPEKEKQSQERRMSLPKGTPVKPSLSPLSLAFLMSELMHLKRLSPSEIAHRYCEYLSQSLGEMVFEWWIIQEGEWVLYASSHPGLNHPDSKMHLSEIPWDQMRYRTWQENHGVIGIGKTPIASAFHFSGEGAPQVSEEYLVQAGEVCEGLLKYLGPSGVSAQAA